MERVLLWLDDVEDLLFCLPLLWQRWRLATLPVRSPLLPAVGVLAGIVGLVLTGSWLTALLALPLAFSLVLLGPPAQG